jgi:hypothetical protein
MTDFITLTCPSCGGKLQITRDINRFACSHCGTEQLVKRGRGIITIAPVVEEIKKVQKGVDKTAAELAIVRIRKEIIFLTQQKNEFDNKKEPSGCIITVVLVVAAIISLFIAAQIVSYSEIGAGALFLVLWMGQVAILVYFWKNSQNTYNPFQDELEQKIRELAKNKKIISE